MKLIYMKLTILLLNEFPNKIQKLYKLCSLSKLNLKLIKLAYVYHLNFFTLLSTRLIPMVTLMKNSLLKRLTNSIIFLIYLSGFLFSFMIVLSVRQINVSPLNLKTFLLFYHFLKMLLILYTEYQWTL